MMTVPSSAINFELGFCGEGSKVFKQSFTE